MKAEIPSCRSERAWPLWVALCLVLSMAPLCARTEAGSGKDLSCAGVLPPDLKGICQRGVLLVARYEGDRPPFFFRQGDAWVGFDVDVARDIAARMGVRYAEDASAASFDEVIDHIASGRADIAVSKLSSTLERAQRVRFSQPYLTVYQALLVNRIAAPRATDPFRDLNAPKYTIGALAGSAYVGYARRTLPQAQVVPYKDFATMAHDVVRGELYAALMDSARANTWRRANPEHLIQVRTTIDKTRHDPLAIAVGWEDTHLLAWINLYLETIRADGTAERLYQKWFQSPVATDENADQEGGR